MGMLYNFLLYRVPFGTIRMQWPGIGAVITGCTAAAVIGFLLLRERNNNHDELSTIGILLLMLLALCTQSRSGIYVSFALVVYRFFPRHNAAFSLLCLLGLTTVLLAFDPIQYIADTRIGSFDSARFDTWQSAFEIFSESGLFGQLFGHGFGAVFPYVDWSSAYDRGEILRALTDGSWNQFVFHSHVMLVQPHNIFVYFLLEIGITGVALFLGYFVHLFVSARQYVSGAQIRRFGLLLVAVLLLNCFDSVFIINVASTFWWTLILLAFSGLVISVKEMAK